VSGSNAICPGDAHTQHLAAILETLPDAALLPVGWIRKYVACGEQVTTIDRPDLNVNAFAKFIGRSPATVRAWCSANFVPGAYKLPGNGRRAAWRIPAESVLAFRERLKRPSEPVVSTTLDQTGRVGIRAWRHARVLTRAA
jgi:hypothetical protein